MESSVLHSSVNQNTKKLVEEKKAVSLDFSKKVSSAAFNNISTLKNNKIKLTVSFWIVIRTQYIHNWNNVSFMKLLEHERPLNVEGLWSCELNVVRPHNQEILTFHH